MNAAEVMSSPVVSVRPDAPAPEVAALLAARRISGVPVLEGERLVGLLSEADLLRARGTGANARSARDLMTREVVAVSTDTPVEEVASLLEGRGIRRVPVLDGEGRVVGIVSRSNLVQALAVHGALPAPEGDAALRERLVMALGSQPWWGPDANVVVSDGVVHFWGPVRSDLEREAAHALAHSIPGVRGVEDHRFARIRAPAAPPRARGVRPARARGHAREGWIESWYSFSFGSYYDARHTGHGPLRAINEKRIRPGGGFTTYGLRDVELVTYMLEGAVAYEDSADHSAVLHPGDVQCVSAGSGVRLNVRSCADSRESRYLQMWIDPERLGSPASHQCASFAVSAGRGRLRLVCSPDGREGSLRIRQDVLVYAGLLDGAEQALLELAPGRLSYVHVARGSIAVNGEPLSEGDGFAGGAEPVRLVDARGAEVLAFDLPAPAEQAGRIAVSEALLDAAVEFTFPASDPIAVQEAFNAARKREARRR